MNTIVDELMNRRTDGEYDEVLGQNDQKFWIDISAEGATPLLAPYEAAKNELRNAGYRGMSTVPALARGFIGNLDIHASKMQTIIYSLR